MNKDLKSDLLFLFKAECIACFAVMLLFCAFVVVGGM